HLRVMPVADYLQVAPCPPFVVLRFDIDYREAFAVRLAQLLAVERLRGTFYFRHHATGFDWSAIDTIAALGHEIGYHYETLDRCGGDFEAASAQFLADVETLRAHGVEVRTVAAHGSPPVAATYAGNLDLLRADPSLLSRAGLHGDAVASVRFEQVTYFSDAGWRWRRCDGTPPGVDPSPAQLRTCWTGSRSPARRSMSTSTRSSGTPAQKICVTFAGGTGSGCVWWAWRALSGKQQRDEEQQRPGDDLAHIARRQTVPVIDVAVKEIQHHQRRADDNADHRRFAEAEVGEEHQHR